MAHHEQDGDLYVDTDFINKSQHVWPEAELRHMGFGEFELVTPIGKVQFDRMRGIKFPGQSGRSHQMYDHGGGDKASRALLQKMVLKGKSKRMAVSVGTVRAFMAVLTSKLTQYDVRQSKGKYHNPNALAHYLGASQRVEDKVRSVLDNQDEDSLRKFIAAMDRTFDRNFPPIKAVKKQVEAFLAKGTLPSLTRRGSLRSNLIRLAHAKPELRPKLLPLIEAKSIDWDKVHEIVLEGLRPLDHLGDMAGKHGDIYGIKGNSMKIRWGRRDLVLMVWSAREQYGKIKGTWGESDYVLLSKATPEKIKAFVAKVKASPTTKELRQKVRDQSKQASQVAKIIADQMGGMNRLRAMLGAKQINATRDGRGLEILWPNRQRSKGNFVVITLRSDDTYDMEFFNVSLQGGKKSVRRYKMLYAEQLVPTFYKQTGWALRI